MGEVLCNGFNLAMSSPRDRRSSETRICIIAIKAKMAGFDHISLFYSVYIMSFCLKFYFVYHELNAIEACWIVVDCWNNSSRCRIV